MSEIHIPTNEEVLAINRPPGVYNAADALGLTMETMAQREAALAEDRAISKLFGIPQLDNEIIPFWPGDYVFTCGLPSNGKSFFARMQMLRIVNTLVNGGHKDRAVVWITTEESVERVTTAWISALTGVSSTEILSGNRINSVRINDAVSQVASWPIYVIGHTLGNHEHQIDEYGRKLHTSKRMSTAEMEAALDFIKSLGIDIVFIALDYLQRIKPAANMGGNREEHVRLAIDWGRDMGHKFSCPFHMITQAKFEVSKREMPMPTQYDSEWSANAGQSADTYFGVCMPQVSPGIGKTFSWGQFDEVTIERGMLVIYLAKQKMGVGQTSYLLRAKPDIMTWELLDVTTRALNPGRDHAPSSVGKSADDYMNAWKGQQVPLGEDW